MESTELCCANNDVETVQLRGDGKGIYQDTASNFSFRIDNHLSNSIILIIMSGQHTLLTGGTGKQTP